jgi:hypothetical protein
MKIPSKNVPSQRLAKCNVCGKISDKWIRYGCFFLEEEYPNECIYICGDACFPVADYAIKNGEWKTPILKRVFAGSAHDISKPRIGYDAQPSQDDLIQELLHRIS